MNYKGLKNNKLLTRIVFVCFGTFLIGSAVGLFQSLELGNDPFSCMNTGISTYISWKFSVWQLLLNIIIFIPTILWYKKAIGLGTIVNMVFVGIVADFIRPVMIDNFSSYYTLPVRIILLIIAVIILCLGVAVYIAADMGMAPYDALAFILEKFTKINYSYFRIATDIICVLIGLYFGSKVGIRMQIFGIGTIITAFGTGPIVRFFQVHVADPLMKKL